MTPEQRQELRALADSQNVLFRRSVVIGSKDYMEAQSVLAAAVPDLLDALDAAEEWALEWQQKCMELDAELAQTDAAITEVLSGLAEWDGSRGWKPKRLIDAARALEKLR